MDVNKKATVEVLGTHFNVNAYEDESGVKTTLLEGSVRVRKDEEAIELSPCQQAIISDNIEINKNPDISKVIAWKEGLFNFSGLNLKAVMRQLERWYDIEVKYEGTPSSVIFRGEMYRNVNLSDVLEVLQRMEIKYKMEGRILTIQE
ncbi:MAG TPA: FecR domain-containing protein [Parasegetibacter sp.]